jgi:hypothetical protein
LIDVMGGIAFAFPHKVGLPLGSMLARTACEEGNAMADIQQIAALIWTSNAKDSGTDSNVYLGIGGREFLLDTPRDDFETGAGGLAPVVGVNSTVKNPEMNDPRSPYQLLTEELAQYPVYLRLDGNDHWKVLYGAVFVYPDPSQASTHRFYTPIPLTGENGGFWLGPKAGKSLHLRPWPFNEMNRMLRDAGLLDRVNEMMKRKGLK